MTAMADPSAEDVRAAYAALVAWGRARAAEDAIHDDAPGFHALWVDACSVIDKAQAKARALADRLAADADDAARDGKGE